MCLRFYRQLVNGRLRTCSRDHFVRRQFQGQRLESRHLLAGDLIAHWHAEDLVPTDETVLVWSDRTSEIVATALDAPVISHGIHHRTTVEFPSGPDSFVVPQADNPLNDAGDFSVSVAFRTSTPQQGAIDASGQWYQLSGLVDANSLGLARGWGISVGATGQIATGIEGGLGEQPVTLISQEAGLHDGRIHVATLTRAANTISLFVDDGPAIVSNEASAQPRSASGLSIGALQTDGPGFVGEIAEVRIYDGALDSTEVSAIFRDVTDPVATDDVYFVTPGAVLEVTALQGLTTNDRGYHNGEFSTNVVETTARGMLTVNDDGSFRYVPHADFQSGVDAARYTITDGRGTSHDATVSFVINTSADDTNVVINELHVNSDISTEHDEFIELYNQGDVPVELAGWYFGQGVEFHFPANAHIPARGYYVIAQNSVAFAEKFGVLANGQFTGRLNNRGETVDLWTSEGTRIDRVDYGEGFPWPTVGDAPGYSMELVNPSLDNQLGGSWRSSRGGQTVIPDGDSWRYFKGTMEPSSEPGAWTQISFDDSQWAGGSTPIGFSRRQPVSTNLDDMRRNYSTVYLRKTFEVMDLATVRGLKLNAFVDDGVNVWINGTHVAGLNVEPDAAFDAVASGSNNATELSEFVLPEPADYLVVGANVIAVQVLNQSLSNSDVVFDATLLNLSALAPGPTPGRINSVSGDAIGPQLRQVSHAPQQPRSGEAATVTIKASDPDGVANVMLEYQVVEPGNYIRATDAAYRNWQSIEMHDDGTNGDASANDSIYTAIVPGEVNRHRNLVRYRFSAVDVPGESVTVPYADDAQPNFGYFVYDGVSAWTGAEQPGQTDAVTFNDDVMNLLPVYHLIANAEDVENSQYRPAFEERRFTGTLVYDGTVYDHIQFRVRGEFSTYVTGKNKWKFFFNRGHEFQARDDYGRLYDETWRVMNFSTAATPWVTMNRGMAGLGEGLAYQLYDLAGVHSPSTNFLQFRVIDDAQESPDDQFSGDLWGLYLALEHPDGRFLDRRGLPDGTTYKVENSGQGDIKNQGRTQPEAANEFRSFMREAARRTTSEEWWRENVDLDSYFSFRAINRAVNNMDIRDGWNHYIYHNPESDKWSVIPWDLDMLYVPTTHWSGVIRLENMLRHEALDIEYKNRARELQDLLFSEDQVNQLVDEYAGFVNPQTGGPTMVDVDQFMWNYNPRTSSTGQDAHRGMFNQLVAHYNRFQGPGGNRTLVSADHEGFAQWIKDFLLPAEGRGSDPAGYGWDFLNREATDNAIPNTPTLTYVGSPTFAVDGLAFETSDFADPQGDQTFGAMQWRIAEVSDPAAPVHDPTEPRKYEVDATWSSPHVSEFQQRFEIPIHVVQPGHAYRVRLRAQDDTGRWSHWSEPIQLVATNGAPSDVIENLRISEVHYNPADPNADEVAAGFANNNDFEFIEFVNIGASPLDLSAVRLVQAETENGTEGVAFAFAEGAVQSLAPGERVVVVEDLEAFRARYGSEISVAGQWQGRLSNRGEQLSVEAAGVLVQQFRYQDDWQPTSDGIGRSLEIRDVAAALASWDTAVSWQASAQLGGTPGAESLTWGDANRDGQFDNNDLVVVATAGEFEDNLVGNSTWETGDWNGDGEFTTADLVLAFKLGLFIDDGPIQ